VLRIPVAASSTIESTPVAAPHVVPKEPVAESSTKVSTQTTPSVATPDPPASLPPREVSQVDPKKLAANAAIAASQHASYLGLTLFNRMAQPFPYYFEIFTKGGQICGTLIDRIQRKENPCQPSLVVYEQMFHDEFVGRGTAPQAVHVYGYALNGWLGAIIEVLLASVVLGLFTCVPARNHVTATIAVMGGLTGYYFSQLPFEGPIIYDHGLLWWMLLVVGYAVLKKLVLLKSGLENAGEAGCVAN
jgi:hypothetical protein